MARLSFAFIIAFLLHFQLVMFVLPYLQANVGGEVKGTGLAEKYRPHMDVVIKTSALAVPKLPAKGLKNQESKQVTQTSVKPTSHHRYLKEVKSAIASIAPKNGIQTSSLKSEPNSPEHKAPEQNKSEDKKPDHKTPHPKESRDKIPATEIALADKSEIVKDKEPESLSKLKSLSKTKTKTKTEQAVNVTEKKSTDVLNAMTSNSEQIKIAARPKSLKYPTYPRRAIRRNQQGTVKISLWVNPEGYSRDIKLLASSGYPLLDNSVLDFVKQEQFYPASVNGVNIASRQIYRFRFVLN